MSYKLNTELVNTAAVVEAAAPEITAAAQETVATAVEQIYISDTITFGYNGNFTRTHKNYLLWDEGVAYENNGMDSTQVKPDKGFKVRVGAGSIVTITFYPGYGSNFEVNGVTVTTDTYTITASGDQEIYVYALNASAYIKQFYFSKGTISINEVLFENKLPDLNVHGAYITPDRHSGDFSPWLSSGYKPTLYVSKGPGRRSSELVSITDPDNGYYRFSSCQSDDINYGVTKIVAINAEPEYLENSIKLLVSTKADDGTSSSRSTGRAELLLRGNYGIYEDEDEEAGTSETIDTKQDQGTFGLSCYGTSNDKYYTGDLSTNSAQLHLSAQYTNSNNAAIRTTLTESAGGLQLETTTRASGTSISAKSFELTGAPITGDHVLLFKTNGTVGDTEGPVDVDRTYWAYDNSVRLDVALEDEPMLAVKGKSTRYDYSGTTETTSYQEYGCSFTLTATALGRIIDFYNDSCSDPNKKIDITWYTDSN